MNRVRYAAALALAAALTACASDPASGPVADGTTAPAPAGPPASASSSTDSAPGNSDATTPTDAATRGPAYSDWEVGASPLPLRPDGFGRMPATPPELRVRRLPTEDLLPPPPRGEFRATIAPVTREIRERMGETWSPQCPVALTDLAHLTVSFRGFDGEAHTGELVVAEQEADGVVSVFEALFAADFPIEEMRLVTTADLEAAPTGDGNNTAGLVCRAARGTTSWSAHARGLAIDLNPFQNPYRKDDVVLPELARSYLDRDWRRPGMVLPGAVAVREFARIGWSWGGDWQSLQDYQHFTATGR